MLDMLLSLIAPHLCCYCGRVGRLLCHNCKYYIVSEPMEICLFCGKLASGDGICSKCRVPYKRAYVTGSYKGVVGRIIKKLKYDNAKAAATILGDLLDEVLPDLPSEVVIVPVPTLASHVRIRGYDQTYLIAKRLAIRRRLKIMRPLVRLNKTTQHGSSRQQRLRQAKSAFGVNCSLDSDKIYLLVDDVVTTGATIKYATLALIEAGAKVVWVAALAR